jgi:hypothetical protein
MLKIWQKMSLKKYSNPFTSPFYCLKASVTLAMVHVIVIAPYHHRHL